MNTDESGSIDDYRLARLLAFDGALADEPTISPLPGAESTLSESLDGLRECVRLLDLAFSDAEKDDRSAPRLAEFPRDRIGRFTILDELGRGGFGVVFRAYDPSLKREIALKVPRPEFLANPEAKRRFLREGWASSRLEHLNIIPVLEAGEAGPIGYIASALCNGPSLASWLAGRSEPVPQRLAARLAADLAGAVEHAHRRDVLHRDLKPSNILLHEIKERTPRGSSPDVLPFIPRICDFGLAKLLDQSIDDTRTSAVLGSPPYMAPEQADGQTERIGPATDVYALGVILYELLTGRPPFRGDSNLETLRLVVRKDPPLPRSLRPGLTRDLETIVLKCLEKEPERRYPDAEALAEDLDRFLDGRPIKARPAGFVRRSTKWARRNPARASLVAFLILSGFVATAALAVGQWWQARQNARLREVNQRLETTIARAEQSERQARHRLFNSMVRQAHDAVDRGHFELAFELLGSARFQEGGTESPGFAWSYLDRYIRDRLTVLNGATLAIESLEVSPDGRILAAIERAGGLDLWDLPSGRVRRVSDGPFVNVRQLAFSPDGETLAVSHTPNSPSLDLFEVANARSWGVAPTIRKYPHGLLFSKDGKTLAGVVEDPSPDRHRVMFWDLSKGPRHAIATLDDQEGRTKLGIEHEDPTLRAVADVLDGKPLRDSMSDREDSPSARGYAFTADRRLVVVGRGSSEIQVREPQGKRLLTAIPYGRTSTMLATSEDSLRDFEPAYWKPLLPRILQLAPPDRRLRPPFVLASDSIAYRFAPSGHRLAYQGMYSQPLLIELETGTIKTVDFVGYLTSITWTPDGKSLIMGGGDGRIRIRNIEASAEGLSFQAHPKEVWGIAWSPDGKSLATSSDDGTVRIWDLSKDECPNLRATLEGHVSLATSVAWSPDGKSLASSGYNGDVRVWDATNGAARSVFMGHEDIVRMVSWSPDGRTLASCGDDWTVRLWSTDRPLRPPFKCQKDDCSGLAWSPDGRSIASVGLDGRVVISDVELGVENRSWDLGSQGFAVAYSPDGKSLAAATLDGLIRVWDSSSMSLDHALVLRGHARWVHTLAFSPDGKSLASGGIDQTVRVWDPSTGEELAVLSGHTKRVNRIAFSPDGKTLASCDHAGIVRLWRGDTH